MKKLPTEGSVEITVHSGREYHFTGPKKQLKPLLTVLSAFNFKEETQSDSESIPWRNLFKEDFAKHGGEAAFLLKGARLKEDLSQLELAEKLGTTQGNISQMESGERPIGKKTAMKLGKILNINYRVFL